MFRGENLLVCSLPLHRHSYIGFNSFRFIILLTHNRVICHGLIIELTLLYPILNPDSRRTCDRCRTPALLLSDSNQHYLRSPESPVAAYSWSDVSTRRSIAALVSSDQLSRVGEVQ